MARFLILLITAYGMLACSRPHQKAGPELLKVRTEGGWISGTIEDSVFVYKGVPYAAPPIGTLRWKAPQAVLPWADTLKCTQFGASPIQNEPKPFMMWTEEFITPPNPLSEDCLFLNIWSGAQAASDKLPVFVWIHGGAFSSGSGACAIYNGADMARQGIVFVSINYRLGVFGFLAHPELTSESEHASSGNYGLMDQIAAIRWIKDNIAAFGGDSTKITIGGQSAGSMSVQALIASPLTNGLVQGAIAESGAGRSLMPLQNAEEIGAKLAGTANGSTIRDLRELPADSILKLANRLPFGSFFPIKDGYVLTEDIQTTFVARKHQDVPLLAGWVTGDGSLASGKPMNAAQFKEHVRRSFGKKANEVLAVFPANSDDEAAKSQLKLGTMSFAGVPNYQWAIANRSNTYLYEFTYVPTDKPGFPNYGAFHTSEVPFALHTLDHWDRPWQKTDRDVESYLSSYWLNFIKHGNPNGDGLPEWKPYDSKTGQMMRFGKEPEAAAGNYKKEFELLSQVH